jgi:peptide/nickel transport system substrate-binding protein
METRSSASGFFRGLMTRRCCGILPPACSDAVRGRLLRTLCCGLLFLSAAAARAETPLTVLRYTPSSDLSNLDPQWSSATTVGQHGLMVYDTLFAQDSHNVPRPQMVDTYTISPDGLTYRFTLRPGLRFQDGQPVTSADVVASINRWMPHDALGTKLKAALLSFEPDGDNGFSMVLKQPFPFLLLALSSTGGAQAIIMRKQDAEASLSKPITTAIGSGPFRFIPQKYVAGVGATWERNPDYIPRAEAPDGLAGGKVVKLDRVEMVVMPDASMRANAIKQGEIDFIDQLPADLVPLLQADPNVVVSRLSSLGALSYIRLNQLYPPFNNIKARQAIALIVNQPDYMAGYGTPDWWQVCFSYFVCGSANGTDAGSEPYRQQNLARAKQLLAEAGYHGEKIIVVATRELPAQGMLADVTVGALQSIGVNVDFQLTDFATLVARRMSKNAPDQGGWNMIHTAISGPIQSEPATNFNIDSGCAAATYFGWPCDATVEQLRSAYISEPDAAKRRAMLDDLSRAVWASLPAILTGEYFSPYAWRKNVVGLLHANNVVFWNVEKTR